MQQKRVSELERHSAEFETKTTERQQTICNDSLVNTSWLRQNLYSGLVFKPAFNLEDDFFFLSFQRRQYCYLVTLMNTRHREPLLVLINVTYYG